MLWGYNLSSASTSPQTSQSASWGYTAPFTIEKQAMPNTACPTYQFKSTSIYLPATGGIVGGILGSQSPEIQSDDPWNPFDPLSGGEVGVIDTPVGEPLILLIFALLYGVVRLLRRERKTN